MALRKWYKAGSATKLRKTSISGRRGVSVDMTNLELNVVCFAGLDNSLPSQWFVRACVDHDRPGPSRRRGYVTTISLFRSTVLGLEKAIRKRRDNVPVAEGAEVLELGSKAVGRRLDRQALEAGRGGEVLQQVGSIDVEVAQVREEL